jgi:hypothetical protein
MTPRDQRALRLGAAIILGAFILGKGIPAGWRAWSSTHASIAEHRDLLARARAQVETVGVLDSMARGIRTRFVALAPRLVAGGTEAEAIAALGGVVTSLADRSHLRLKRVDGEPDSLRAGALRRVVVDVELEGDWGGASTFFRGLGRESVALSLGAIDLRAQDPASPGDRPEVLLVRVEVSGWYLEERAR